MLALGAEQIVVLAPPDEPAELASLWTQAGLAEAFLTGLGYEGSRLTVLVERDPDAVEFALYDLPVLPETRPQRFTARGTKRDFARTALAKLREAAPFPADVIALPRGAPYGRIRIRTEGCTLCLACVGACPTNALGDNPDRPEVSFTEAACVQCGICVATCPESDLARAALRLHARRARAGGAEGRGAVPLQALRQAVRHAVLGREDGAPQGALHVPRPGQLDVIGMCDDCRVITMAESAQDPMAPGPVRASARRTITSPPR